MHYKTKPIKFKAPMIQALREGRKTQHRVVMKPQPSENWKPYSYGEVHKIEDEQPNPEKIIGYGWSNEHGSEAHICAYKVGDFVKVNELMAGTFSCKKTPANFVKWASRLTLEITGVKVERLQDISEEDAIKEGVEYWLSTLPRDFKKLRGILSDRYNSIQYRYLWESLNGKDSWKANPWVWVLEFIVHNKNIDEVINAKHV